MYIASASGANGRYYTLVNETATIQNIYCVGTTSSPVTNQFINQSYNYALSTNLAMFPGQTWELISDGVNWNAIPANSRIQLSANTTFYVSNSGYDILGNGTTAATPWATPQFAVSTLQNYYDLGGYTATIQLADGDYTVTNGNVINLVGQIPGQVGCGSLVITGNASSPTNVVLVASGQGHGLSAHQDAYCTIQNMKISANGTSPTPIPGPTDGGCALWAGDVSKVQFNNIWFGSCSFAHITANFAGFVANTGNYTIMGGAPNHAVASVNSFILLQDSVNFYNSGIAFSGSFLLAQTCSTVQSAIALTGNYSSSTAEFALACTYTATVYTENPNGNGASYYLHYPGGSNSTPTYPSTQGSIGGGYWH